MSKCRIRTVLVMVLVAVFSCRAALAQQYYWSNLAGMPGGSGTLDGAGLAAQFNTPNSVAVDGSGNAYVADRGNNTIRKVTAAGVVTTLAGSPGVSGSADGKGSAARFNNPCGIAVDAGGTVYVADTGNYTIRKVASDGTVTTLAGSPGQLGAADGSGSAALFSCPSGVAVDGSGNVYVADTANHIIRKVTFAGAVTTFAGTAGQLGTADGIGSAALFNQPNGVAVDGNGNVYVADTFNHSIRKISAAGAVTTLAGNPALAGIMDGAGTLAMFNFPYSLTLDGNGNVFVADTFNHTIRKVTATGVVTTLAGSAGVTGMIDGAGTTAQFNTPSGVAAAGNGVLYVADSYNHSIRKVTGDWGIVTTFVGSVSQFGLISGTGSAARFKFPNGVGVDANGSMYVADTNNSTIRKVTSTGVVTTLSGASGGLLDGNGTAALFNNPSGIAVVSSSNMYVADTLNSIIRQVTFNGTTWVTTTIGGLVVTGTDYGATSGGIPGRVDGVGSSARFSNPSGIAADNSGVLYIADTYNQTIRQMTLSGSTWTVTTLTGTTAQTGTADGIGSAARFSSPFGIAVDSGSNLYVADYGNHTIRKMTASGTSWAVTTLAGSPGVSGTADGIGSAARFNNPAGLAVDSGSNLYVADSGNNTIRKITPNGTVVTIGGTPGVASGANGIGSAALFNVPCGVTVNAQGIIYVADNGNNRISVGSCVGSGTASLITGTGATVSGGAFPNGVATNVYFQYGTSVGYGSVTSTQSIGSGTGFVQVNAALGGLTANTTYHYRLVVANANGTFYGTDQIFATPPVAVPAITSATTASGMNGLPFTNYTITASNSATIFGASGLPTGLNLNPVTGIISGTPTTTGTFAVPLSATNIIGTGTKTLTISITSLVMPIITSGATVSGVLGSTLTYQIVASANITSYSATGLPDGVSINTSTGLVSGVPTVSGVFPVTIGATNASGGSTFMTLTMKVVPAYYWSTFAGMLKTQGHSDGTGVNAQFMNPCGLAVDRSDNVYVADISNNIIRKITPAGVVTTLAGSPFYQGSSDGIGSVARFKYPVGVAVDAGGNLYVADRDNNTIRKMTLTGTTCTVSTLAGTAGTSGSADGIGSAARFYSPNSVAVDSGSNVYVADYGNNTIRKITLSGTTWTVSTLAGTAGTSGSANGTGSAARFYYPSGVTVDSGSNVYVADYGNNSIRKITPLGVVTTLAGTTDPGVMDGLGSAARFKAPQSIVMDSGSNFYVLDYNNQTVRKITLTGTNWIVTTIGGTPTVRGTANGAGTTAQFYNPQGLAVNSAGYVYVADTGNQRISIGASQLPPSIGSTLTDIGTAGVTYYYDIIASNNPYRYSAVGLPTGLSVNAATGLISGTPTTSGSFSVTINATNYAGNATNLLTLILQNTCDAWKRLKFTSAELSNTAISDDMAAPAGDGIANLLKYALNLDPKTPSVAGLPLTGTAALNGASFLTLTYAPAPLVSDITYTVEVSDDLQTWNSGPGFTSLLYTGTASTITVQDVTPIDSTSKRFIRLKVTKP